MARRKDSKSWEAMVTQGESSLKRFVRDKKQPLGKYFGESILWHVGDQYKQAARAEDMVIEDMALELAKKAISTQELIADDGGSNKKQSVMSESQKRAALSDGVGLVTAKKALHDEIMAQFEFPSLGGNRPSSYLDFDKREFEATAEAFETRLRNDITKFIEAARTHCRDGGVGRGG